MLYSAPDVASTSKLGVAVNEVVSFLGGSALLLAAVAWLIRELTVHFLNKDAEVHKEIIRAQVVRSSRLHEERGTVIREIYGNLVDLIERTYSFVHLAEWIGEPTKDEKQKHVAEALEAFRTHFNRNKIYLSPELCGRVQAFTDSFVEPAAKFAMYRTWAKEDNDGSVAKEFHDAWFKAFDKMGKEVPAMREALESEFREVLGTTKIDGNA